MKIIYYLTNGRATPEDVAEKERLHSEGHKVFFSNGSIQWAFQDSCDAVYLSGDFPHVKGWADSAGIQVLSTEPEPEPEPEKPKRTRKSKAEQPSE